MRFSSGCGTALSLKPTLLLQTRDVKKGSSYNRHSAEIGKKNFVQDELGEPIEELKQVERLTAFLHLISHPVGMSFLTARHRSAWPLGNLA